MNQLKLPKALYLYLPIFLVFSICFGIFYALNQYNTPKQPKPTDQTIDDLLKNRSPIFHQLYHEAQSIFPLFAEQPRYIHLSHQLGGTQGKSHTFEIRIPKNELTYAQFEKEYLEKYVQHDWTLEDYPSLKIFTQNKTQFISCVYPPYHKQPNQWIIQFKAAPSFCH